MKNNTNPEFINRFAVPASELPVDLLSAPESHLASGDGSKDYIGKRYAPIGRRFVEGTEVPSEYDDALEPRRSSGEFADFESTPKRAVVEAESTGGTLSTEPTILSEKPTRQIEVKDNSSGPVRVTVAKRLASMVRSALNMPAKDDPRYSRTSSVPRRSMPGLGEAGRMDRAEKRAKAVDIVKKVAKVALPAAVAIGLTTSLAPKTTDEVVDFPKIAPVTAAATGQTEVDLEKIQFAPKTEITVEQDADDKAVPITVTHNTETQKESEIKTVNVAEGDTYWGLVTAQIKRLTGEDPSSQDVYKVLKQIKAETNTTWKSMDKINAGGKVATLSDAAVLQLLNGR